MYICRCIFKPPAHAPTPSLLWFSLLGYLMALTQQNWPVEGLLGSHPGVPLGFIFLRTHLYFRSPRGLGVSLGVFLGPGVRKYRESSGGS